CCLFHDALLHLLYQYEGISLHVSIRLPNCSAFSFLSFGPWTLNLDMIPIHELLNRIRWDTEFAKGNFELGYYDRTENRIILVPVKEITFPDDSPQTFQIADLEGQLHRVPF